MVPMESAMDKHSRSFEAAEHTTPLSECASLRFPAQDREGSEKGYLIVPSAAAVELLQSPTCADLRFWFRIHLFVLEVNAKPLDTNFFSGSVTP